MCKNEVYGKKFSFVCALPLLPVWATTKDVALCQNVDMIPMFHDIVCVHMWEQLFVYSLGRSK